MLIVPAHKVIMQADLSQLADVRKVFLDYLASFNLDQNDLLEWKLVFSEAVTNAILHGCKEHPEAVVIIEWWVENQEILLSVQDPGRGPPEEKTHNPMLPEDLLSEHGRGLPMIHRMSSRWEHWRSSFGYRMVIGRRTNMPLPSEIPSAETNRLLEELSSTYESLSAFYRLSANLLSTGNAVTFIEQSVDDLRLALDFSEIFLIPGADLPPKLQRYYEEMNQRIVRTLAPSELRQLAAEADGQPLVWDHRARVKKFSVLSSWGSGACVPINAMDKTLGWLVAAKESMNATPSTAVLGNLSTFADIFGITLANTWLQEQRDKELQTRREMELAAQIQRQLLPIQQPGHYPGCHLWLRQQPAREVAGDFAEAILDQKGNLILTIIDVMGKGVPAALLAAIYRSSLHLHLRLAPQLPLAETIASINQALCQQLGDMILFVTCTLIRINNAADRLECVNAGHCPAIFFDADGIMRQMLPSGPPLGILPRSHYTTEAVDLHGGECLLLVTDGCYEWLQPDGTQFGWDNLCALARETLSSPEHFWSRLLSLVNPEEGDYADDLTVLQWMKTRASVLSDTST